MLRGEVSLELSQDKRREQRKTWWQDTGMLHGTLDPAEPETIQTLDTFLTWVNSSIPPLG